MNALFGLISGILFGAGLTVAGMTDPQKILNFLDLAAIAKGKWDPTLLAVFAGALAVMAVAFRLQAGTPRPWYADTFKIPNRSDIDARLVGGSALFGIGWGLVGLCPGPAVAAMVLAPSRPLLGAGLLFFGAMMLGVWLAVVLRVRDGAPEVAV